MLQNRYTTRNHGSPDIYTLGPQAWSVYIRQTTHANGITIKYTCVMCTYLLLIISLVPCILYIMQVSRLFEHQIIINTFKAHTIIALLK